MIKHFITIHDNGGEEHVINLDKVLRWTITSIDEGLWRCKFYFEGGTHEITIPWKVFNDLVELPEFFV